jgi:hypothetical protein
MNLSEGGTTPVLVVSPSGSGLEHTAVVSDKSKDLTPRCWKTVYYLLDLYATMPETKTITHRWSIVSARTQNKCVLYIKTHCVPGREKAYLY